MTVETAPPRYSSCSLSLMDFYIISMWFSLSSSLVKKNLQAKLGYVYTMQSGVMLNSITLALGEHCEERRVKVQRFQS